MEHLGFMTLTFAILKLTGDISWSWWGVFAPAIVGLCIIAIGWLHSWIKWL